MNEVTIFNIGGEDIQVVDTVSQEVANQALQKSTSAENTANQANAKVTALEQLSRVEISYSASEKKITIVTGNHEG